MGKGDLLYAGSKIRMLFTLYSNMFSICIKWILHSSLLQECLSKRLVLHVELSENYCSSVFIICIFKDYVLGTLLTCCM